MAAAEILAGTGPECRLGMVRHLGNCMRGWGQLADTVLSGKPARRRPSVLGAGNNLVSFIRAMHEISQPLAVPIVAGLGKLKFNHVLDLAWVSAIVHQNSWAQNRKLFEKVFAALEPGGLILIRDIVMDATRTRPETGAMFAVNMLVNTSGGGTFTVNELRDDLSAAGFSKARLMLRGEAMDSVVCAKKPLGRRRGKGA